MTTFARLVRLIAPFRWWIALSLLLGFATIGAGVGLMAMSAYLISRAALAASVAELSLIITAVRFFAISRAALRYAERYVSHRTTFSILTRLRVWFYTSIEPLAPARLLQYRSGDLLTRVMADIDTLENFYLRVVVPPLAAALVTLLGCAILGAFDVWLGVVLLVFLVLTGVALPLTTQWLSHHPASDLIAARALLNATLVDEIQGLDDLLVFDSLRRYQARAGALGEEINRIQEHLAVVRGLGNGLGILLASLAGLTVLGLAIPMATRGQLDGVFLALLPLTAIASFEAVQPLAQAWQNLEASQAAARRLFELIDAEPAVAEPATPSPTPADFSLVVSNLSFAYTPGETPALDDISFSVPTGGRLVVVGPSGAGKSTLVNLLLRFWDYSNGSIRLGGHELREYHPDEVRALFAVVAQDTYLFAGSLRDNLLLADAEASDNEIIAACREAQLDDFIQSLPQGYDTWIGENGLHLSGGERQRLAIARAVLKNAPMLILDEATAHLDAVTAQNVAEALARLMHGRTTLIITHQPPADYTAGPVLSLDEGRMALAAA